VTRSAARSRRWASAFAGWVVGLTLLVAGCDDTGPSPAVTPREPPHVRPLTRSVPDALVQPGGVHRGVLKPGETVLYPLNLRANEAMLVEVEQAEVDVKVEILSPDGHPLLAFDAPTHRAAPERVCVVAKATGVHTLVIAPFVGAGGYAVRLLRLREAHEEDYLCFAAARTFQSAQQGKAEARISAYECAGELWERADEPFLAALAWRESASLWRDIGPPVRAVDRLERALGLARGALSSYLEVSVLNRLGLALSDIGDMQQARVRLEEAEGRARKAGDVWGHASALTNLGWLDDLGGQPHRAIDRYSEALPLWRQVGDPIEIAQALQSMAIAYGVLDDHDRALDLLAEALELTRKAGNEGREANILLSEGWIQYLRGRPADGLPALQRALEIRRRKGDRNGEAVALDRLGTLLRESGGYLEAERAYKQSLELSVKSESLFDVAGTIANLGCLYSQTGRLEEAHVRLRDALRRYRHFDDPRAISHIEYCFARVESAAGELDSALEHIRRALRIVDQLRESARTRGHYYQPIWLWQDYAEFEVALLFRKYRKSRSRGDLEGAFQAADLARARTLFEQVMENRIGIRAAASDSLLRAEGTLQDELSRLVLETTIGGTLPRSAEDRPRNEIRRLRLELERIRAAIRAADPQHEATSPRPVTVKLARQLLAPRTALLSYVLGKDRSYLLTLDASGLTAHELPPRRDLEASARAFHQAVQESRQNGAQWRLIASELSHQLLPKQAVPLGVDRLIVVPDGLLHYVPFSALVSPRDDEKLMIDDFEVTYVPSVSILARLRERSRKRAQHRIAVFADPVFSREDDRLPALQGREASRSKSSSIGAYPQRRLPRLLFSGDEALSIAALAGPRDFILKLGFEATKLAVLKADLQAYSLVHFATHALIDEQSPELSGLVLSRFDAEGKPIDAELRLHEIHGLELSSELTVLSGCQTALGKQVRGNGLEGFAQGFLYAGSSRVLVSLWKVDDKATARLMAEFYRRLLKAGAPPTEALRQAQNWLRQQPGWEEPYYWAPFVLQGDD
jgi:CHAT domain-containing protein/tetratricopeptide (TPR) repeat protein